MWHIIKDLLAFRKGQIVHMTIWDGFAGEVKIIKNKFYKWLVEIVNVNMCYPSQRQLQPGDRMWVYKKDLYSETYDTNCTTIHHKDELPF